VRKSFSRLSSQQATGVMFALMRGLATRDAIPSPLAGWTRAAPNPAKRPQQIEAFIRINDASF
jgi:hypothetical protein